MSDIPPSKKSRVVKNVGLGVGVGLGSAGFTWLALSKGPHLTPEEVWQYGAAILVIMVVVTGLKLGTRLIDAGIRVLDKIAERIENHEKRDDERHQELIKSLADIRLRQESLHDE
jgi:hypothetical protein